MTRRDSGRRNAPTHLPHSLLAATLCAGGALAQANLLQNGSFETGSLAPWSIVGGSASVQSYGVANLPGANVAATIGGGGLLLRDGGGGAIEQVVTTGPLANGATFVVEGFVGGGQNDWTRIVVRVLDAGGTQLALHATGYVTDVQRNLEAVMLKRRLEVIPPANAAAFAVRIEFADQCCGGAFATADLLRAFVVNGSTTPPPAPIGSELLGNAGFEQGWNAGSPLDLAGQGWEGAGTSSTAVLPYSNSNGSVPSGAVSCIIDGAAPNPSCTGGAAGNLAQHVGSDSALVQRIDLRGSTPLFTAGNLMLRFGAHLGGIGGEQDTARVEVRFRNALGTILQTGQLGPIDAASRNYESVLLRRNRDQVVPPGTAYADVVVAYVNACCGASFAVADNLSVVLLPTAGPAAVPLNVNLLPNASFESGSLGASPLSLVDATGWSGFGSSSVLTQQYGSPGMPGSAFATNNGLGTLLLRDGGNGALRATVDLRGSAALVASNRLAMHASGWLGGVGSEQDTAEMTVRFVNAAGVSVGALVVLPAVTAAERQNATRLLYRTSQPFPVPSTATTAIVEVAFANACCGGAYGLADDLRLVAFDLASQSSAMPYPGTDPNRLMLATGVDATPLSGLGQTVRSAHANQVLRTMVGSPDGTLNGAPVLLALDAFLTGQPRNQLFPDLWVDPGTLGVVYSGWGGAPFSPVVVPLAQGGNVWSQLVPPGLAGISVMLQAVALPTAAASSPNGLYFATDGHEIRLQ